MLLVVGCDPQETGITYALTLEKEGEGRLEPGVGIHIYKEDELVEITATPDEGFIFLEWIGDVAQRDASVKTVLMDSDKTIKAIFGKVEKEFAGGDGTETNPYLIETPMQLDRVRDHLDKHFRQIAHLDLSSFQEEGGFIPLGNLFNAFNGSYHGNGFTIENLYIHRPDHHNIGLFGVIGNSAVISHVTLKNVDVVRETNIQESLLAIILGGLFKESLHVEK